MEKSHTEACATILSPFSQASIPDTRQALKAKLIEAQYFVRCIQDAHNSLSSALQLPDEIWIEIGWIVYTSCDETWYMKDGLLKNFLLLTHISHRLRSIFHSVPNYWTRLDLESPAAKLVLQLSGDLGIRASYNRWCFEGIQPMWAEDEGDRWGYYDDEIIAMQRSIAHTMFGARERIEEILVVSNHQGMRNCVERWEGQSFPRLQHLTLQVTEWSDAYQLWMDPCIGLHTAPLNTLRLHGVYPRFKDSCYTALRHLTLSTYSNRSLMMRVETLIHILSQCKLLEELCLFRVVDTLPSSQPSHLPVKISFDNLRSLSIAAYQHTVHFITQLVQAPVLQHLYLHVQSHNIHPVILEDLVPASQSFSHSIRQTKSMAIHYYDGVVTLSAPYDSPHSQNHTAIENLGFSFKIEFELSFGEGPPFSFGTLASFFGTNLACDTLVIELRHRDDEFLDQTMEAWSTVLFPALPNLRRLHVSFQGERDHPQSLGNVIKALTPQTTQTALCSNLEYVSLSAIAVASEGVVRSMGWPEVQLVRDMVKSRHSAHAPLSSLRFDTNMLPEQPFFKVLMEELGELVPCIEVVHPGP